jgi:rubredoxin
MKYICRACGYVFSVEDQEPDYTRIVDMMLPDEYACPNCGASKAYIEAVQEHD